MSLTEEQIEYVKLVEYCYNGLPLALVEVWPQRGDLVLIVHEGSRYLVGSVSEGVIRLRNFSGGQAGAIQHSLTNDSLIYMGVDGERDGYRLALIDPNGVPGMRQWRLALHQTAQLLAIETVNTIEVRGPLNRPSS